MLRFCQNIAEAMRFGEAHSDTSPEQNRNVAIEFETNSKWKAACVNLCQMCRLCCLNGKQPL